MCSISKKYLNQKGYKPFQELSKHSDRTKQYLPLFPDVDALYLVQSLEGKGVSLIRKATRAIKTLTFDHRPVAPEPEPVAVLTPQEPDGFYFPNSPKKHNPGSVYQTVSCGKLLICTFCQTSPSDFLYCSI
jgi:hypothetical protein